MGQRRNPISRDCQQAQGGAEQQQRIDAYALAYPFVDEHPNLVASGSGRSRVNAVNPVSGRPAPGQGVGQREAETAAAHHHEDGKIHSWTNDFTIQPWPLHATSRSIDGRWNSVGGGVMIKVADLRRRFESCAAGTIARST